MSKKPSPSPRCFVLGDLHGAHKALLQCLERSRFDRDTDSLIALGDLCDGWPEVDRCLDELSGLKHCTFIRGNHDLWALEWATQGSVSETWLEQGGANTIASYRGEPMPASHRAFLEKGLWWHEHDERLYVHAGFDPSKPIQSQPVTELVWQRTLVTDAVCALQYRRDFSVPGYKEVFIGHTPTTIWKSDRPLRSGNLWLMDTGAGHGDRLTLMDVETKEVYASDPVRDLYPGIRPRDKMCA